MLFIINQKVNKLFDSFQSELNYKMKQSRKIIAERLFLTSEFGFNRLLLI